jgi:hypothetical protein
MHLYILDENGEPVLEPDFTKWGEWFENHYPARRIALSSVGEWTISTIFLGMDHSFEDGPPVLWETMVFGPEPWSDQQWRFTTREGAISHHDQIAEYIRQGGSPEE